ncbi:MAG: UDP-galactopyranose mutase [Chthoniobacteraceae bacterium]|nr:UDP-galactopyranose mutase [Chthoniobacteraceae bacterium]
MDTTSSPHFCIVGAGFSGAVLARALAEKMDCRVTVLDERPHLGGNCHTERDAATGVMVHCYGPHIFHTSLPEVWDYVTRFGRFGAFVNRVKAVTPRGVFSLPINLHTINQFFGKTFNPAEAKAFIATLGDASIAEPRNFEEQALKFLGRELYETFFYGYTRKQWGCEPRELAASILKRLPVRFNYDDNYYNSTWQGIPEDGYTAMVEKILAHPAITVRLGVRFEPEARPACDHLFYTGPLDAYFGHRAGRLGYRTVTFERGEAEGDFQGNAVLNYGDPAVPYTRIHEHKHFAPWEEHARTVYFKEYSQETGPADPPYYPKRLDADHRLLREYRRLARQEHGVSFLGRLATYRYMDMDKVIGEALAFGGAFARAFQDGSADRPIFPNADAEA